MGPDGPKWGREVLLPTDPDLADILGRTDFDFENFIFGIFWVPNFWLGPSLGPPTWARLGPTHLGLAWAHPLMQMTLDTDIWRQQLLEIWDFAPLGLRSKNKVFERPC